MPVVFGDVKNVARIPLDGVLWVSSPEWRPGGTSVISMNRKTYQISGGVFRTDDLVPGPCVFEFRGDGDGQVRRQRYEFVVPDQEGELNFLDLLDTSYEYPAPVVGQAQAAAREARASADVAVSAADRVGSAERVLEAEKAARAAVESTGADRVAVAADRVAVAGDRAAVELARDDAVRSVNEAVSEASDTALADINAQVESARGFRDEAQTFRDQAEQHASTAGAKASAADASASAAGESATAAGEKASAAAASAEASEQARVAGEGLLVQGRSLAEQGHADADRAEAARSQAEGFARTSGEQATLAEQHAREAAASAESAKQGAPEGGWTKAQLHVNVQAQLDKVDSLPTSQTVQSMIAGKADTTALQEGLAKKLDSMPVSENVTNGTLVKRTGEGRIKAAPGSAGDELVTKSQLDTKVAASDQSKIVYARGSTGDTALPYSENADAYTMAMRTRAGSLYVGPPVADDHAATKQYVDSTVASSRSKYLLLAYANSSEMALPRTTAKAIPWVTESGTITHQHTSGADAGVLIKEPGVYQITTNFPYIDFYSDKVSYELQTAPPGGSYSTVKFALMESSIAWDRSDSMSWPLALASQMWIRLLVTCNNGTAGGWNRNKKIKADMLLTKIS